MRPPHYHNLGPQDASGAGGSIALRMALTLLILLQGVAGFLPGPELWGLNHLAYVSVTWRLIWPALGLTLIWLPIGGRVSRWLVAGFGGLLERRWLAYGLLPLAGLVFLWLARGRTHFLGDGYLLADLIGEGDAFHGFDFLAYHLHFKLYGWLGLEGTDAAQQLFAYLSVVTGAGYVAAAAWSARCLASERSDRAVVFGLLTCSATVLMFMGYVECYAALTVCLLLFFTSLVRHWRGEVSLWVPSATLAAGLVFHLNAMLVAPLLAVPLFRPPPGAAASAFKRLIAVLAPILCALVLVAGIYLLSGYDRAQLTSDFVTPRQTENLLTPWQGERGLLNWHHWKNLLNLLLLLAPVPLAALLVPRGDNRMPPRGGNLEIAGVAAATHERHLLLGGVIWIVLLMALLHLKLGMVRDWDLFAPFTSLLILAAASVMGDHRFSPGTGRSRSRPAGWMVATAFCLALPWFWVNAGTDRSVARFREVTTDLPAYPRALAHENLGTHFRRLGDHGQAEREYAACTRILPDNPRFHLLRGQAQLGAGNPGAAIVSFTSALAADSTYASARMLLVRAYLASQNHTQALHHARLLAGLPAEDAEAAALHGAVAERLELWDEAVAAYTRAIRKDPDRADLMERIGGLELQRGHFDNAAYSFRKALERDPALPSARLGLAEALWLPHARKSDPASDPAARAELQEALSILDSLITAGQADEAVQQMRLRVSEDLRR